MTMQATFGVNRFSERVLGMMLAFLVAMFVGGAGGYVVRSLASSEGTTVARATTVAPALGSIRPDAVDRALAKTAASSIGSRDSHLTISSDNASSTGQVAAPFAHEDSHLTITPDRSTPRTRADRQLD
jgi:hypothetical protein